MDIKRILETAIFVIVVSSCTVKEMEVEEFYNLGEDYIYATFDNDDTKVFADNALRPCWEEDDLLTVYDHKSHNYKYRFAGTPGESKGAFVKISDDESYTGSFFEVPYMYAIYPYRQNNRMLSNLILLDFPGVQNYREGTFAKDANFMLAISEDRNLAFKNLCGYLVLKLYGDEIDVRSVSIRGNNSECMSGDIYVQAEYGKETTIYYKTFPSSVTLYCETPVSLGENKNDYTEFWFVIPPLYFSKGFSATVVGKDGQKFTVSTTKSFSIDRNKVSKMSPVEVIWDSPSPDLIQFADGNVKDALIAKGLDLDNDGEISFEEARSLTNIGREFFGEYAKNVTSFNEFKYFTSVKRIGEYGFLGCSFSEITLPESLEETEPRAFSNCRQLKSIVIPEGVTKLGDWSFSHCESLTQVILPQSLESLGEFAFTSCPIKEIKLPSKLAELPCYAFGHCAGLTEIHIPDNITKIGSQAFTECTSLASVTGCDGLITIDDRAFEKCSTLKEFNIPQSVINIGEGPFWGCKSLERFTGKFVEDGGRALIVGDRYVAVALASITDPIFEFPTQIRRIGQLIFAETDILEKVIIPEGVRMIGELVFYDNHNLREVVIPSSITEIGRCALSGTLITSIEIPEGVEEIAPGLCTDCPNLRQVTIPLSVKIIDIEAFSDCPSLELVVCKPFTPPVYSVGNLYIPLFYNASSSMQIQIPSGSINLYRGAYGWSEYADQYVEVDFPNSGEPDYYISTDYSKDGTSFVIQSATEGTGIDIVIMGDCFVDRDIASGLYRSTLENAIEKFFEVEPYASLRNMFNVYGVNVVSSTEGYSHAHGKLLTWFGDGTSVGGDSNKVWEYALCGKSTLIQNQTLVIVLMNRYYYAGTCYLWPNYVGNYGQGFAIAYLPLGTTDSMFAGLVQHEAGGHGFAKLADEYSYNLPMPESEISSYRNDEPFGWWKNVDFTADPTKVKWSSFLFDSRYDSEDLDVYEGACTYATGAYRPSMESLMNHNTGGYNAPSRYAIWHRIGKLAYGEEWNGTYEDFVAFDTKNRAANSPQNMKSGKNLFEIDNFVPLAPPVVIRK